ncbi:GNAT family N-acetyltransferase [Latilactobacillus fuchuensis]|uniref:N-acetyltransferase domain-containing protein n=2 Tax=Latilactobacillus fuchuensis TaxID=164393 RepID=A0A2N9DUW9_9LACO|nr:GNAT family N-acetyltransferase [Latilactobacillus fuchuensis]KRL61348.1 hypothetical protein FC69_GL000830 [Latilactobacillus fuchuensis DSM 14340 = JCM 11249]MCP8857207.1 GNAT family N-acetyltransferase [Latilactobacillus fuchuensis]SPC38248.1 conserved hypothetical protein [Latilactobacillus fuchuensis]
MHIRNFEPTDIKSAAELYVKTFQQAPWSEDNQVADIERHFQRLLSMNTAQSWVLEVDHKIVGIALGFVRSWYRGEEYQLDTLCIDPEKQGQGYGKALIQALQAELVANDVHAMILDTDRGMPAEKFYQKLAFTKLDDSVLYAIEF